MHKNCCFQQQEDKEGDGMRFFHLADLHLGKSIYGKNLVDTGDQPRFVDDLLTLCDEVQPDALLISGDVYDRSNPGNDAVALFDRLIAGLNDRRIQVLVISGNHDSGQRLSFASGILSREGVHICGTLSSQLPCVRLQDEYGPVDFTLMPYLFPALVADVLGKEEIRDYETAIRSMLSTRCPDPAARNVLLAHQAVLFQGKAAEKGGSETMVGGVGEVSAELFDGFDYVALGHIHAGQIMGKPTVRYAGSPLAYHFDETRFPVKGPVLVTLGAKGEPPQIRVLPVRQLHPLRSVKGTVEQILEDAQAAPRGEYLQVIIEGSRKTPEIDASLRSAYRAKDSEVLEMLSTFGLGAAGAGPAHEKIRAMGVDELFSQFYEERMGQPMTALQQRIAREVAGQVAHAPDDEKADQPDEADITRLLELLRGEEERA